MGLDNKDCYRYAFEANKLVTISSCNKFTFSFSIISKKIASIIEGNGGVNFGSFQ
jgi:hypothetical protein